ncbi:RNA-directed DNA polymerase [Sphingomonas endolithica]|uniref:RNA-directed DNA polymerase n=1 Tax=Sphingomonas endolithica TaxID=2972485 RepID=UPI0021AF4822|nr:RNA-directed DNA polymerase [Sphingomonas sp. ZFBP2030]
MTLKLDLLTKGHLPENLPPTFRTYELGTYLAGRNELFSRGKPTRAATYNASKRGLTRRVFSFIHPGTSHDLAEFISARAVSLNQFISNSTFSLSAPRHTPDGDRAVEIASHGELEEQRLLRLARYRFVARTDISRFYHSIYTHSVPWAIHGKPAAKADQRANSGAVYANRLDQILRHGQDGQTVGIPVGPDASRYVAEFIGAAIDAEFVSRGGAADSTVIRHVDDVWIGADTHAEAEAALWRYRESIRAFELDINESKTRIHSDDFQFSDSWPTDIAAKIEFALASPVRRVPERLRSALEHAFSMTALTSDDGVLKYTLRYLDRSVVPSDHWTTIEPFLMRSVTHYSHTVDYVARMLVWRHLARGDLDVVRWAPVLLALIARHGRLGNDGEVCWATYAALRLEINVPLDTAKAAILNCGALTAVAILSAAEAGLVDPQIFDSAWTLVNGESGNGSFWPLLLEWKVRQWTRHAELEVGNDLITELIAQGISIFDASRLPPVFDDVDLDEYSEVERAIEKRSSQYDDDDDEEEDDDDIGGFDAYPL